MRELALLGAVTALAAASLAAAQPAARPPVDRNCSDDRGVDRCSTEQHRNVLQLYGLPPIERMRDEGAQVRRVFYVDGYGRDLIALTFIRARGADPTATVHFPRPAGGPARPPLSSSVPAALWSDVLARSQHFDRALVPRADAQDNICLHSWVFTAEAVDPPNWARRTAVVRRAVQDACNDGLVQPLSISLAELALPLFPHCAILDPDFHRGPAARLAACGMLSGDRFSAAEVLNRMRPMLGHLDADELRALRPLFLEEAVLDWGGQLTQRQEVAATWLRNLSEPRTGLYVQSIEGESADRVRIRGTLGRTMDDETAEAPVEMVWSRVRGFEPRIERITVGAFRRPPSR
ncbi:MAG TPA: hypothetical protein VF702_12145 [Allosphingosinicella sp.]|jgi:hypothetical protein